MKKKKKGEESIEIEYVRAVERYRRPLYKQIEARGVKLRFGTFTKKK